MPFCRIGLGVPVERLVMRQTVDPDCNAVYRDTRHVLHPACVAGHLWGRDTKAFPITFDLFIEIIGGIIISTWSTWPAAGLLGAVRSFAH